MVTRSRFHHDGRRKPLGPVPFFIPSLSAYTTYASGRTLPSTYSGATYKTLSSETNATHWTVEVLCSGCSKWATRGLTPGIVNSFAWAWSRSAVSQPANPASSFAKHNNVGMFSADLNDAKVPQATFQQYVSSF